MNRRDRIVVVVFTGLFEFTSIFMDFVAFCKFAKKRLVPMSFKIGNSDSIKQQMYFFNWIFIFKTSKVCNLAQVFVVDFLINSYAGELVESF